MNVPHRPQNPPPTNAPQPNTASPHGQPAWAAARYSASAEAALSDDRASAQVPHASPLPSNPQQQHHPYHQYHHTAPVVAGAAPHPYHFSHHQYVMLPGPSGPSGMPVPPFPPHAAYYGGYGPHLAHGYPAHPAAAYHRHAFLGGPPPAPAPAVPEPEGATAAARYSLPYPPPVAAYHQHHQYYYYYGPSAPAPAQNQHAHQQHSAHHRHSHPIAAVPATGLAEHPGAMAGAGAPHVATCPPSEDPRPRGHALAPLIVRDGAKGTRLLIPPGNVRHVPAGPSTAPLEACPEYDQRAGTCPNGTSCPRVHFDAHVAVPADSHVNFVWRSLDDVVYERFPPAPEPAAVSQPGSRHLVTRLPTDMLLKTAVDPSGKRLLSHCAHFLFGRRCDRGVECKFVHAVNVDPTVTSLRRAPVPEGGRDRNVWARNYGAPAPGPEDADEPTQFEHPAIDDPDDAAADSSPAAGSETGPSGESQEPRGSGNSPPDRTPPASEAKIDGSSHS